MAVIQIDGLTKRFGQTLAVDNLSFEVEQGTVTGFLGPNGAGKTTTLRSLLGLVTPTSGRALIEGQPYRELEHPTRKVGALLESASFHPARTARNALRVQAAVEGIPTSRVDELLGLVGLADAANKKVRGFSMGMRQRLGLASALVGDPEVLILDEPANGLDPEGIRWLRGFLRHLADQGRTVLVSSHVLSEVAQTVDRVVIISHGRAVANDTLDKLTGDAAGGAVRVRSPRATDLAERLRAAGLEVGSGDDDGRTSTLVVRGATTEAVGELAGAAGITLHELAQERSDLEEIFFSLTGGGEGAPVPASGAVAAPVTIPATTPGGAA